MNRKYTHTHLNFSDNLYFFVYKTWVQNCPEEYYHAHEGMEFLYIHEGNGRLILNDRLYLLKPRTLVYFQPYQVHLVRFELPRLRSIIKINLPLLKQYLLLFPYLSDFVSRLERTKAGQQIVQLTPAQDGELTGQLAMIHHTLSTAPSHERKEQFLVSWLQFMSYLKSYIFEERSSDEGDKSFTPRHSHHVENITAWIERHYKEPFCLDKLSADVHLSGSYLSNLFRSFTGVTITEYMTRRRLDEARLLLANSSLSIDQVGKHSGFPNPAYFSRCFKKRHKLTPQQYRATVAVHRDSKLLESARFE